MTFIEARPIMKHTMNPISMPPTLIPVRVPPLSISSNRLPIIIGILIRNEYLAAILSQPIIRLVAIVVPLLLIPGITAMPWEIPMIIACL